MSLLLTSNAPSDSVVVPEGVSFDGVTDYLSRSSDLVGNVDSKTFTFSCWVYSGEFGANKVIYANAGIANYGFYITFWATGELQVIGRDGTDAVAFNAYTVNQYPKNTFLNIQISIDLTNTANRSIYVNETLASVTWLTYVNSAINFTSPTIRVGAFYDNIYKLKGRLSHLFLDYTYRDLSIEANRRLFITADGKPADGLASLNPILYLPLKDASTAHINLGTGGNFVQNGTLSTADRGANQDNCVASYFDTTDDKLSKTYIGIFSTSIATISMNFKLTETLSGTIIPFSFASTYLTVNIALGTLNIYCRNSSGNYVVNVSVNEQIVLGKEYSMQVSFDTSLANNIIVVINGSIVSTTITSFVVGGVIYYSSPVISISEPSSPFAKEVGELYFDTNYIDLATNNPFWDSVENKPIPVRKAMESLGSNPLICMPIDASNPTKNYGSGGDFTLNGGGLVGARGASEFWARSARQSGTGAHSNYLIKSGVGIPANLAHFSLVIGLYSDSSSKADEEVFFCIGGTSGTRLVLNADSYNNCLAVSTDGITFRSLVNNAFTSNAYLKPMFITLNAYTLRIIYGSIDVSTDVSLRNNTYDIVSFLGSPYTLTANESYDWRGAISIAYFTTDYIDFSQEVNRNLFVNQLGYPRDLKPLIADGTIPNPLIYLPFDDTTNLGKNYGTGGDFTKVGTVTAGADFSI